jgi:hypothetical protein
MLLRWVLCLTLFAAHIRCVVAMHGEERERERWEVGPTIMAAPELPQSVRGSERGCAATVMVVGSVHALLSGIG